MSLAELRPAAAPDNIPTADELIIRARTLAPRLRERAVKAERDRNIPQQSVDEYLASGLIHTLQPKRWGGYEHDHEVAFDIAIELGKSTCGSSAWCLNYLADHACILAHFPEEAQHDVWSRDTAACIATSAAPTGKVAVAPGGYRLDGRWSWCSGLRHSQWELGKRKPGDRIEFFDVLRQSLAVIGCRHFSPPPLLFAPPSAVCEDQIFPPRTRDRSAKSSFISSLI